MSRTVLRPPSAPPSTPPTRPSLPPSLPTRQSWITCTARPSTPSPAPVCLLSTASSCKLWGSPRTGGGGANLGMHDETPTRGHNVCYETPGHPHLGPCPDICSPRCSPRWGYIHMSISPASHGARFAHGSSLAVARAMDARGAGWRSSPHSKLCSSAPAVYQRCR